LFFSCCDSVVVHFKHAATRRPRRKPTAEICADNTAKLRPQESALALRAAGASQLLKPASTTPRSYGCRHRPWQHGHVHATRNERRRGHRPGSHDQAPATRKERRRGLGATVKYLRRTTGAAANNGLSTTITPPCSAGSFEENSELHTGARPSVRLCVGPELARCIHYDIY
jgi:hypothetical protein